MGYLRLFEVVGSERELKLVAEQQVDGCVYAIDTVNGLVAAAVNTSVRHHKHECLQARDLQWCIGGPLRNYTQQNHEYYDP